MKTQRTVHLTTKAHTEAVLLEFYQGVKAQLPEATLDMVVSGLVEIALKGHKAEQQQLKLEEQKHHDQGRS